MARSRINPKDRARAAGISLPPRLITASKKVADAEGKSLSQFIREHLLGLPSITAVLRPAKK